MDPARARLQVASRNRINHRRVKVFFFVAGP
jgi:hypothetical protein